MALQPSHTSDPPVSLTSPETRSLLDTTLARLNCTPERGGGETDKKGKRACKTLSGTIRNNNTCPAQAHEKRLPSSRLIITHHVNPPWPALAPWPPSSPNPGLSQTSNLQKDGVPLILVYLEQWQTKASKYKITWVAKRAGYGIWQAILPWGCQKGCYDNPPEALDSLRRKKPIRQHQPHPRQKNLHSKQILEHPPPHSAGLGRRGERGRGEAAATHYENKPSSVSR